MSLESNYNSVAFASLWPVDKIALEGTTTYTQPTGGPSAYGTLTIPHTLGYACFITLAWSVDAVNYYPAQAVITTSAYYSVNGSVDASNIYLYFRNNSGSDKTFYVKYALDTIT